jgi:hypothetical protein
VSVKGISGTNRSRQACAAGHAMYGPTGDLNVKITASGEQCAECWRLKQSAWIRKRSERRLRKRLSKAEKLRLQQIRDAEYDAAEGLLNKICYLEDAIPRIEKEPRIAPPGQLEFLRTTLRRLKREQLEQDVKAAGLSMSDLGLDPEPAVLQNPQTLTAEQQQRLEWLQVGGAETEAQVQEMNNLASRLNQPEQPTVSQDPQTPPSSPITLPAVQTPLKTPILPQIDPIQTDRQAAPASKITFPPGMGPRE